MRLDLRSILHVPGASLPFSFALDLSGLDFYGEHPFVGPVQVSGTVRNQADALVLEGTAETTLELVCDRCLKPFCRDMRVPVDSLLAETLEDEENDEILLLDNGTVDLDEVFTTLWCWPWTPSMCAPRIARGCAPLAARISTRDPAAASLKLIHVLLPSRSCWIKSLSKFCPARA